MYIERMFKRLNACWQMTAADRDEFLAQKSVERHQLVLPQAQVPEKCRRDLRFDVRLFVSLDDWKRVAL